MIKPLPGVDHISPALVAAFACMVRNSTEWVSVEQVNKATGASKATIYRRFGNLVTARVLQAKRMNDFRHFRLHPDWQAAKLGRELHRRGVERGLFGLPATATM